MRLTTEDINGTNTQHSSNKLVFVGLFTQALPVVRHELRSD